MTDENDYVAKELNEQNDGLGAGTAAVASDGRKATVTLVASAILEVRLRKLAKRLGQFGEDAMTSKRMRESRAGRIAGNSMKVEELKARIAALEAESVKLYQMMDASVDKIADEAAALKDKRDRLVRIKSAVDATGGVGRLVRYEDGSFEVKPVV